MVDIEIGLVGVWRSDTAMTRSVCSTSLTQRGFVQWVNTSKIVLVRHTVEKKTGAINAPVD